VIDDARGRPLARVTLALSLVLIAPRGWAQVSGGLTQSTNVTTVTSASPFDSTLARLERAAVAKGLTVPLRPTTLVIAGNPAAGTPLMQADPTIGVELPLRFLVWQGEDGRTRVSYDPIKSIAARHAVKGKDELLTRMTAAIEGIVAEATR
jgi:uncharacterized protein (DUF302 family)